MSGWLVVVAVLLGAAGLRLWLIPDESLWFDEAWSAHAAAQPDLIAAANADATNPPLYYALLYVWGRGAGDSEFALRLFSALLGVVGVALAARLAGDLFGGAVLVWAAGAAAGAPLLVWAAGEARMYTLLAALVTAAALAWHRLRRRPTRAAWLILWGAELALLYAHNTAPVVVVWLNAVTGLAWLLDGVWRSRRRVPSVRVWLAGQALVLLLWSPYFVTRYVLLSGANDAVTSAPDLSAAFASTLARAFVLGDWTLTVTPGAARPLADASVAAVVMIVGLLVVRRPAARWLLVHGGMLVVGVVAGLLILQNEMHGRYLVMIAPLVAVLIGAGLAQPRRLTRTAALALALASAALVFAAWDDPRLDRDDARGMVAWYAATLDADDAVLAWSYADRYDLAYYWDRLGVQARRITLPEGADRDAILPLVRAAASGDVALNVWYTQRADYRGMLDCLLAHGASDPPRQHAVQGMTTLVYTQPALDLPPPRPFAALTALAQVDSVGGFAPLAAHRAACVPITVVLTAPTAGDLKAVVTLHDALDREAARADVVFATANQRTSSGLPVGTRLTAYALVRLAQNAPAGLYSAWLRLYTLDAADGTIQPLAFSDGRDAVPIGTWAAETPDWGAVRVPRSSVYDAQYDGPRLSPPPVETRLDAPPLAFATLSGFTLDVPRVTAGEAFTVELVWQALAQPPTRYTVFVQLVADDGRVIAQSDAPPAGGARPTRGWRPGEYIADAHTLTWNDAAWRGRTTLIAGMYDAATGVRSLFTDGADFVVLGVVMVGG